MTRYEELQKEALVKALEANAWNRTHAARWLGVSVRTIRNWEIKFGLRGKGERPQKKPDSPGSQKPELYWKRRTAHSGTE